MTYDDAMVAVSEGKLVTHPDLPGDFVVMDVERSGVINGLPLLLCQSGFSVGEYSPSAADIAAENWAETSIKID